MMKTSKETPHGEFEKLVHFALKKIISPQTNVLFGYLCIIEREFIPSSPSSVAWQPGADHSLAIGTETGLVGLQDCRVGVGIPSVIQVHTRFVRRLSFSPLQ